MRRPRNWTVLALAAASLAASPATHPADDLSVAPPAERPITYAAWVGRYAEQAMAGKVLVIRTAGDQPQPHSGPFGRDGAPIERFTIAFDGSQGRENSDTDGMRFSGDPGEPSAAGRRPAARRRLTELLLARRPEVGYAIAGVDGVARPGRRPSAWRAAGLMRSPLPPPLEPRLVGPTLAARWVDAAPTDSAIPPCHRLAKYSPA